MNGSKGKIPAFAKKAHRSAVAVLLIAAFSVLCPAHNVIYKPPPPKPPPKWKVTKALYDKYLPKLGPKGGVTGGQGARSPGMPVGPGGGMTKKSTSTSAPRVSWEYWWARNRYAFFEIPNLADNVSKMFPSTPLDEDDTSGSSTVNALRTKSVNMIRPLLDHQSARMKRGALIGLAMLNDTESLPGIQALLQDGNQTVRDSAVLALGIIDSRDAKHSLMHIARGTPEGCRIVGQSSIPAYFRGFALISLALKKSTGIVPLLRYVACDLDSLPDVRAMAIEGMGLWGGEEEAKFLMEFVEDQKKADPLLVSTAVNAVGKTGEPFTLPFLVKNLFSKHSAVIQSAIIGLGSVTGAGNEEIVNRLQRCYRSSNDMAVKGFSLLSMGIIGGPEALTYIDRIVVNGSPSDRPWACIGLGLALKNSTTGAGKSACEKHLIECACSEGNRSTRGAAAIALGLMRSKEAVRSLIGSFEKESNPELRGYYATAMGMIGDPSCTGLLRESIREDAPQLKAQAAVALALMNDTDSAPELVDIFLTSNNDATKAFVSLSLAYMGDVRIVTKIFEAMERGNDLDDLTMLHCMRLVSKLISGRTSPFLDRLAEGSNLANEYPMVEYLLEFGI